MKYLGWVIAFLLGLMYLYTINTNSIKFNEVIEVVNTDSSMNFYIMNTDHDENGIKIVYDNDTTLSYILNKPFNNKYQLINFFKNGVIQSKYMKDENNLSQGMIYYFYNESGNLKGQYKLSNGIETGIGVSYYDTAAVCPKEYMTFKDGRMIRRTTYNKQGRVIKEE